MTQARLTTWLLLTLLGCSAWAAPERLHIGAVGREAPQNHNPIHSPYRSSPPRGAGRT